MLWTVEQVLLTLLGPRPGAGLGGGALQPLRVRALACRCLLGLARDRAMCSMLGTLQAKLLPLLIAAAATLLAQALHRLCFNFLVPFQNGELVCTCPNDGCVMAGDEESCTCFDLEFLLSCILCTWR